MKKILAAAIMILMLMTFTSAKKPIIEFETTNYDFGTVSDKSAPVVHEFKFTNVSDEPVAILSVSTQCGCTRPEYPARPLQPGKSEKIKVTFLPAGQQGAIVKDVTVRYRSAKAKSSKRLTLKITGTVVPE